MANMICFGGGSPKCELTEVWTNPSPTQPFPASTVTIGELYDYYLVKAKGFYSVTDDAAGEVCTIIKPGAEQAFSAVQTTGATCTSRRIKITGTSAVISVASGSYIAQDNAYCVPLAIYGITGIDAWDDVIG